MTWAEIIGRALVWTYMAFVLGAAVGAFLRLWASIKKEVDDEARP